MLVFIDRQEVYSSSFIKSKDRFVELASENIAFILHSVIEVEEFSFQLLAGSNMHMFGLFRQAHILIDDHIGSSEFAQNMGTNFFLVVRCQYFLN